MIVYYNGVRLSYFDELTARLQANAFLVRLQSDATQSRSEERGAGVGGSALVDGVNLTSFCGQTATPPRGKHGETIEVLDGTGVGVVSK